MTQRCDKQIAVVVVVIEDVIQSGYCLYSIICFIFERPFIGNIECVINSNMILHH